MSRIAKKPITLPPGVEIALQAGVLTVKGKKGTLTLNVHPTVEVKSESQVLNFSPRSHEADAMTGTTRALVSNMVTGVTVGFEKKLELVGVGYRAQAAGKVLNLTLGYSHPIAYPIPEGVNIETPSQTEILVRGIDRQLVGQVASDIRAYRPPEPYKGKGIKYAGEVIVRKEAKKK